MASSKSKAEVDLGFDLQSLLEHFYHKYQVTRKRKINLKTGPHILLAGLELLESPS